MPKQNHDLFQSEAFLLSDWHERTQESSTFLFSMHPTGKSLNSFVSLDEVGRGCIAGPVVVCATFWQRDDIANEFANWLRELKDSKKMSARSREQSFATAIREKFIKNLDLWENPPVIPPSMKDSEKLCLPPRICKWTDKQLIAAMAGSDKRKAKTQPFRLSSSYIGFAGADEIDALGIIPALGLAASRALEQASGHEQPQIIFFDGHCPTALRPPWDTLPQILVTKGDDLLKSISASSVLAKVVRDRWMRKYSNLLPIYFFDEHCGYGTAKHRAALLEHGPSPLHRLTFLKNICTESVP
jgi:ribonuclease HII